MSIVNDSELIAYQQSVGDQSLPDVNGGLSGLFRAHAPTGSTASSLAEHQITEQTRSSNIKGLDIGKEVNESDITRRLKPEQRERLTEVLQGVVDTTVDDLVQATREGDLDAPIFKALNCHYYALLALMQKLITENEFFTILTYAEQLHIQKEPFQRFSLFREEGFATVCLSSTFWDVKYQSLVQFHDGKGELELVKTDAEPVSKLTQEQQKQFFEELSKRPPLEQCFLLVKAPIDPQNIRSILPATGLRFNVFSRCMGELSDFVIYPSTSMMEIFLKIYAGENGVTMHKVVGACPSADFEDPGSRIVQFIFPGLEELEVWADGYLATGSFSHHDFYHCCVSSTIPAWIRNLYIEAGKNIKRSIDNPNLTDRQKEWLDFLYNKLLDMDLPALFSDTQDRLLLLVCSLEQFILLACLDCDLLPEERKLLVPVIIEMVKAFPLLPEQRRDIAICAKERIGQLSAQQPKNGLQENFFELRRVLLSALQESKTVEADEDSATFVKDDGNP